MLLSVGANWNPTGNRSICPTALFGADVRSPPWSRENRGLRMNTKALGVLSGVVLLALAYEGIHGLVVVGALMLALWVVRSGCLGATAEDAECWRQAEQEREADRRRQVERERQAQQRRQQ